MGLRTLNAAASRGVVTQTGARGNRAKSQRAGWPSSAWRSLTLPALAPLVFGSVFAREIEFPAVDPTQGASDAAFAQRQDVVLRFYGCGRERAFEQVLSELRSGNHDDQGEGMTFLVSAKIQMFYRGRCDYQEVMPAVDVPTIGTQSPACASQVPMAIADRPGWVRVLTVIEKDCLRQQINQALQAYRRHGHLGSSDLPCIPLASGVVPIVDDWSPMTEGEYDVDVRELMRVLYLGGGLAPTDRELAAFPLDRATINHLWNELLTVRGAPGPESYSPIYDCGNREEQLGLPADYVDDQTFVNRALDDLGDAGDYLLRRFLFLLTLLMLHSPYGVAYSLTYGGLPPLDPITLLGLAAPLPDPLPFARVPETENHLLMIESSRYLTNKAMLAQLASEGGHPNIDVLQRQQDDTRDWLLKRLQSIAQHDFDEYNARPYQRYTLNAIQNLYDFGDSDIKTAARIVLDYASAKAVVGSNRARRYAPYRRLSDADGYTPGKESQANFYNRVGGADYGASRILMLAGQTQLQFTPQWLAEVGRTPLFGGITATQDGGIGGWVNIATSSYRLPDPIAEIATSGSATYFQRIKHAGVEIYRATPSYLLTSGGAPAGSSNTLYGIGLSKDRGIALPTTLMPTDGGYAVSQVIRFEGLGTGADRLADVCLDLDFACGVNLRVGDIFDGCREYNTEAGVNWTFINSARCTFHGVATDAPGRHHFYVAIGTRLCGTELCRQAGISNYGILEAVDAPAADSGTDLIYNQFKASRPAALNWSGDPDDHTGRDWQGTYQTWDGRTVTFNIDASRMGELGGAWSSEVTFDYVEKWAFLAEGTVIHSTGDGLITLRNPNTLKQVTLDYRQWNAPVWSKNY